MSDPRASYLVRRSEIDEAVRRVLAEGPYIRGPEGEAFEREFAAYVGVRHGVAVGNGTDALHVALRAVGVLPGDEVVTVSHTAVATVAAIELARAVPVLADVSGDSRTLDPASLAAAITPRTRAVVPVHLYGHPAAMPEVLEVAERHGLRVVEDCAQAHGASLDGRRVGAWGDAAAFSFYPTKNLGAFGDGGMVVTDHGGVADRARLLREYGWRERYRSEIPGLNSRLDEVQAALLRVKLRHLDEDNGKRRALAREYAASLEGGGLTLPREAPGVLHAFHLYVVEHPERDALAARLAAAGIGTLVHYPVPVHLQDAYRGRIRTAGRLSETLRLATEVLSLPLYPELPPEDARRVAAAVGSPRRIPAA